MQIIGTEEHHFKLNLELCSCILLQTTRESRCTTCGTKLYYNYHSTEFPVVFLLNNNFVCY